MKPNAGDGVLADDGDALHVMHACTMHGGGACAKPWVMSLVWMFINTHTLHDSLIHTCLQV